LQHTLLNPRPHNQPSITRRRSNKHARRIRKTPSLRHTLQLLLGACNMCRIPALTRAKHLVAGLKLRRLAARKRCRGLQDDARELGAGNPGKCGLVLVFAADLEQVKEVGGRGVDGDEVFVGFGDGRGEVEDFEVFGALGVLVLI
jgi:hypothetical protein